MADVLYGVTMEEQGISKIVSVKFHKAEEVVTDHTPASLERPLGGLPSKRKKTNHTNRKKRWKL